MMMRVTLIQLLSHIMAVTNPPPTQLPLPPHSLLLCFTSWSFKRRGERRVRTSCFLYHFIPFPSPSLVVPAYCCFSLAKYHAKFVLIIKQPAWESPFSPSFSYLPAHPPHLPPHTNQPSSHISDNLDSLFGS